MKYLFISRRLLQAPWSQKIQCSTMLNLLKPQHHASNAAFRYRSHRLHPFSKMYGRNVDADEAYIENIVEEYPRLGDALQDLWIAIQQLHRVLADIFTNNNGSLSHAATGGTETPIHGGSKMPKRFRMNGKCKPRGYYSRHRLRHKGKPHGYYVGVKQCFLSPKGFFLPGIQRKYNLMEAQAVRKRPAAQIAKRHVQPMWCSATLASAFQS